MQDYGSVTFGLSPSAVKKAQSNIATATGLKATGTPNFLAIEWSIGHNADPAITSVIRQMTDWRRIWLAAGSEYRALIKKVWNSIPLKVDNEGWRVVLGPASAIIATLHDIGWRAPAPDRWHPPSVLPDGVYYAITDNTAHFREVTDSVTHWIRLRQWQPHLGQPVPTAIDSMCAVPDIGPAKRAHKQLLKDHHHEAGRALVSVVLNRSWSAVRKSEYFPGHSPIC